MVKSVDGPQHWQYTHMRKDIGGAIVLPKVIHWMLEVMVGRHEVNSGGKGNKV